MTTAARTTIREFAPADYGRWIGIVNASYPDYGWTVEEMHHDDEGWDHAKFLKRRLVASLQFLVGALLTIAGVYLGAVAPESAPREAAASA